jgi:hypothetical protein
MCFISCDELTQWFHYIRIRFYQHKKPANGLQLAGFIKLSLAYKS